MIKYLFMVLSKPVKMFSKIHDRLKFLERWCLEGVQ